MRWRVIRDGKTLGLMEEADIALLVRTGLRDLHVQHEGGGAWVPIAFSSLAYLVSEAAPVTASFSPLARAAPGTPTGTPRVFVDYAVPVVAWLRQNARGLVMVMTAFSVFGVVYGACSSACSSIQKDMAESEAKRKADEQRAHDEAVAADNEREAQKTAALAAKMAQQSYEHSLDAGARTSVIAQDITAGQLCEAKRILSQAPDGGVADLAKARRLIAVAEAKQLAAERKEFEASRHVVCADGDGSGCLCNAPSHQGCCSHHHGIAGCEAYPKEVSCP